MSAPHTRLAFEANDLDASAAIDMERADALRREATALRRQAAALHREVGALTKRASGKRAKAAELRRQVDVAQSVGGGQ